MNILEQIKKEVSAGQVSEYSEVTAKLSELKSTYGTEVPDASTKDGYERAKEISKICTSIRTATENTRKEYKAPVLEFGRLIDSEAKRITSEVLEVETPFKEAYKAVDEVKKQRKLEIENRIIEIKDMIAIAIESNSKAIEVMIDDLSEYDVSNKTFGRRVDEASALVAQTLEKLTGLHVKAIEREAEEIRIEAERAELEKLRREAEERESAQREAELKAQREAEIKEAEDRARIAAEEKAKRDAEIAEREKIEAVKRAEQAERERVEYEKLVEQQRIESEERAKRAAEEAAERAKQEEINRQREEQERIAEEESRREANKKHVGEICKQSKEDIITLGIDEKTAKIVVSAIAKGQIRNISIKY